MLSIRSVLAVLFLLSPMARAQVEARIVSMPGRIGHAMAFDSGRSTTVMVGGVETGPRQLGAGGAVLPEVWERRAGPWDRVPGAIPPAVTGHATVGVPMLPSGRPGILLFGGMLPNAWQFQDHVWSPLSSPVNPPPRRDCFMALDRARGVVVMVGGVAGGTILTDHWEWSPATGWVQIFPAIPGLPGSPNAVAGIAFNPIMGLNGRVTLVGTLGPLAQVTFWDYDPLLSLWNVNTVGWPPLSGGARHDYAVAESPIANGILLFGGIVIGGGNLTNALFHWNGTAVTGPLPSPRHPVPRDQARLVLDTRRGRLVLHGGRAIAVAAAITHLADTWEWDGSTWSTPCEEPTFRDGAGLVYASQRGTLLLHGGGDAYRFGLSDTWERIGGKWFPRGTGPMFATIGTLFPPASPGSICYDSRRDRVILFDQTGVHEHDGSMWQSTPPPPPPQPWPTNTGPIAYHAAADQVLLLTGTLETWLWSGVGWSQLATNAPLSPALGMTYDSLRRRVVAVTGSQTWSWSGSSWTSLGPTVPPLTMAPPTPFLRALAYDPIRDRSIALLGSASAGPSAEQLQRWERDGNGWINEGLLSVGLRGAGLGARPALVYDPATQRSILVAGNDTGELVSTHPPSFSFFGSGCPGTRGIPRLYRLGAGPWIGYTITLGVASGAGTTPLLVALGFSPMQTTLGGFGLTGCTLYTDIAALHFLGGSPWTFMIPANPALVGLEFYNQALVADPGANPANAVVSDATKARIGRH